MKKICLLITSIFLLIISGCNDNSSIISPDQNISSDSFIFVAGEGNFYTPNSGSISYIDDYGNVNVLENIGSTIHSVEVYNDMLLVSANGDQKILVYSISDLGIEYEMELLTDGQSPRDIIVINDKAYFPTWDSDWNVYQTIPGYIKVLDLNTFEISESIEVGIMPEGMLLHDGYLWVANSGESSVAKINISSNIAEEFIDVGPGPQFLTNLNDDIYIARTFYDENWIPSYGTSKISNDIVEQSTHIFSAGGACGGSIMSFNNKVYRSFDGGIAEITENLQINESARMGNFNQDNVYHIELVNNNIFFAITNYSDLNQVAVLNVYGDLVSTYNSGITPGDFAFWTKSYNR